MANADNGVSAGCPKIKHYSFKPISAEDTILGK